MGGWGRALCGWGRARGLARLLSLSWGGVWWGGMCGCFVGGCLGDGRELCGWDSGLAHLLSLHWGGVCGGCWRGGLGRSLLWGRGLLLLLLFPVSSFGDGRGVGEGRDRGGRGELWGCWQAQEHPLKGHLGLGGGDGIEVEVGPPSLQDAGAPLHQSKKGVPGGPVQGSGGEPGQLRCGVHPVHLGEGAGVGEEGSGQLWGDDPVKLHPNQRGGACRAWGVAAAVELRSALATARHLHEHHAHVVLGGEGGA